MAEGSPTSVLHLSIIRWIADNFYLCEGCTVPRCLLYELYMESCSPNTKCQVNPATFGKLIRRVFPDLGTRRLGTRGNTRYHYDGIAMKSTSSFYARYCSLLSEENYHSGNACSSGGAAGYNSNSQNQRTVLLLADEYYSHCRDILHMVRRHELDEVENCIMSFWRSLQPERIALMSLPDVCQLFKSYDRQLYKEIETILFYDFLEEVPVEHMTSIRLFSKNVEAWLLNALQEFPLPLKTAKTNEVTAFIARLRRKTDLSNMAKTMRKVLNSESKVTVLQSDLRAVINQGFLDVPGNLLQKFRDPEELQNDIEFKCLNDLMALLAPCTDIRVLLNCVSSNLQAFVIQPSRSKEEFKNLASDFQLKWSFLLNAVGKAMTLNYAESFGSWHLLNLLLVDFVTYIFLSYMEETGDESFWAAKQNESPVLCVYEPSYLWGCFVEGQPQANAPQTAPITLMQSQSNFELSNVFPEFQVVQWKQP
ncbi:DNA-binding protein RFX8 [Pterocles gutturalis]